MAVEHLLLETEYPDLSSLLSLRQTSRALRDLITGHLPGHLRYSLIDTSFQSPPVTVRVPLTVPW